MLSDNTHYSLLEKLDDEEGEWWGSYTEALTEDDDWEMSDVAVLAIAYLVESGCLTYEDVEKKWKEELEKLSITYIKENGKL